MSARRATLLATLWTALAVPPLAGWDLDGRLVLTGAEAQSTGAAAFEGALVFFEPKSPLPPLRPGGAEIVTENKTFAPSVLLVTPGTRLAFPNRDPILHNVFSVSDGNPFDLGLYPQGPGPSVTLDHPGLVRVYCNVHHDMVAYVWVAPTPYWTRPGRDGAFRLAGLPAGPGTLTAWHYRGEPRTLEIAGPTTDARDITLVLDKPEIPRHLDKTGHRYTGRRQRRYDG